MAFRGRGRGRGGFGYGRFAKQEKYEVFPEIDILPHVNLKQKDEKLTQKDKELKQKYKELNSVVRCSAKLTKFWRSSPYFLEDPSVDGKKDESRIKRPSLSDYMMMTSDYLPSELAVGKNVRPIKKKKIQWDLQSDLQKLDIFEKLDQNQDFDDDEDDFNMNDDFGDGMQNHCTAIDVNGKKMSPKKSAFDEGCY
ncbi:hypothetical protein L2E82_45833 [Cichorium intybus]|uniref:Uncharacterized protein n=1 Tax=Cichorium intybus TaxID=13427 RepID=A0ACB8ZYH3_CICIN|nr:hypothetical protein L2E82_45833 [Cichorium intybus]